MICPVELTSEMSTFQAGRGKPHVGGGHEALQRDRRGADYENPAAFGQEDQLVAPAHLGPWVGARAASLRSPILRPGRF
jgi:hypothetical protein